MHLKYVVFILLLLRGFTHVQSCLSRPLEKVDDFCDDWIETKGFSKYSIKL